MLTPKMDGDRSSSHKRIRQDDPDPPAMPSHRPHSSDMRRAHCVGVTQYPPAGRGSTADRGAPGAGGGSGREQRFSGGGLGGVAASSR